MPRAWQSVEEDRLLAFDPYNCPLTLALASVTFSQSPPLDWASGGPFEPLQRIDGWLEISVHSSSQCRVLFLAGQ